MLFMRILPPFFACLRRYGESLPGDLTSTQDLGSLTVENALADLAAFMTAMEEETALTPKDSGGGAQGAESSPRTWLMIGGSYPGALSAWFRLKYPELATAAWSSSGVILAVENFTAFDQVKRSGSSFRELGGTILFFFFLFCSIREQMQCACVCLCGWGHVLTVQRRKRACRAR